MNVYTADELLHQTRAHQAQRDRFITTHNAHFDLICDGLRVEVKAAAWSGGRYQAALRSNAADVLILDCRNGRDHFFVVPWREVAGLTHLKISQHDPADYRGRLRDFLEAWSVIDKLIAAGVNHWQPPLPLL